MIRLTFSFFSGLNFKPFNFATPRDTGMSSIILNSLIFCSLELVRKGVGEALLKIILKLVCISLVGCCIAMNVRVSSKFFLKNLHISYIHYVNMFSQHEKLSLILFKNLKTRENDFK